MSAVFLTQSAQLALSLAAILSALYMRFGNNEMALVMANAALNCSTLLATGKAPFNEP